MLTSSRLQSLDSNVPATDNWLASNSKLFEEDSLRKRMAYLNQTNCLSWAALLAANSNNENSANQDTRNCMKLNAAPQYFDGGLIRMNITNTGGFHYMSCRNNNFSNRGQKASIYVYNNVPSGTTTGQSAQAAGVSIHSTATHAAAPCVVMLLLACMLLARE